MMRLFTAALLSAETAFTLQAGHRAQVREPTHTSSQAEQNGIRNSPAAETVRSEGSSLLMLFHSLQSAGD